jgi:CRP-like cAMP-binding protein
VVISDGELVDEAVASALPMLTHRQMLQTTRHIRRIFYQPGACILRKGEHNDLLFFISSGEVEVVIRSKKEKKLISRVGPGQFFGEIELVDGSNNIAAIHATDKGPVTLSVLHRDDFYRMIQESSLTREYIAKIVHDRLEENRSKRKGKKHR